VTPDERIEAIRVLGYSAREAAFLVTAIRHSGYFVGRQFMHFAGTSTSGKAVSQLTTRLTAQQHATVVTSQRVPHVYDLVAKRLHATLNDSDKRLKPTRSPIGIKTRLMALDYVLEHRSEQFLASDRERDDYLTGVLGIDTSRLPHWRHEELVGLSTGADHDAPRLFVVYLAQAGSSLLAFRRYLRQRRNLFDSLIACRIVYASDSPGLFDRASTVFERSCNCDSETRSRAAAQHVADLLNYFRVRRRYETRQLAGFSTATLDRLRDDRERFEGARFEGAYERWVTEGDDDGVRAVIETNRPGMSRPDLRFETHRLNHSYAHCGTRSESGPTPEV